MPSGRGHQGVLALEAGPSFVPHCISRRTVYCASAAAAARSRAGGRPGTQAAHGPLAPSSPRPCDRHLPCPVSSLSFSPGPRRPEASRALPRDSARLPSGMVVASTDLLLAVGRRATLHQLGAPRGVGRGAVRAEPAQRRGAGPSEGAAAIFYGALLATVRSKRVSISPPAPLDHTHPRSPSKRWTTPSRRQGAVCLFSTHRYFYHVTTEYRVRSTDRG